MNEYPTALGASSRDAITLLGHDLARDVMGEVGFGELAFWLATQERPTRGQVRFGEAGGAERFERPVDLRRILTRQHLLQTCERVVAAFEIRGDVLGSAETVFTPGFPVSEFDVIDGYYRLR